MALALAQDPRLRVHVHLDERSGAFTALGLAKATGRPVAVLTTSGTGAVEMHPAVVEASYAGVPLLVLTADRPPELQGVGAPQTIDQQELYGGASRLFVDAGAPEDGDAGSWRALGRLAFTVALTPSQGPVHLNLPFREPLLGQPGPLPPAEPAAELASPRSDVDEDVVAGLAAAWGGARGVIVAGAGAGDATAVHQLAGTLGWPVLADPLSGCRTGAASTVAHADALLRSAGFAEAQRPDLVVRLGRPHASKVLGQWLAASGAQQVLVEASGLPADPDGVVGQSVLADPAAVVRQVAAAGPAPAPSGWFSAWATAERAARGAIEAALSVHREPTEPGTARTVAAAVPDDGALVVSSSMPVRDLEWYAAPRKGGRVLANRGANGIDGVVSTAVGVALSGAPTLCLLGDIAFLHDTNGLLGAGERDIDLTVVVVDNDGGGIFSFLPPKAGLPEDRYEQLFGTPHGVDVAAVAAAHGASVAAPAAAAEVGPAIGRALQQGGVQVVVVRTDRSSNVAVHDEIHAQVARALLR
jgi:2-succinyl-5-enolpyruvyl-6-hydroxy-3-cyclohexene-1-carboxylate synthase